MALHDLHCVALHLFHILNEATKKELAEVSVANRLVDKAEEEVTEVHNDVDILIGDITANLKHTMRHSDDASRRRIMRSYGVDFTSISHENLVA